MTFDKDFKWQERYYQIVRRILKDNAMHIIKIDVADDDADMKQATDFVVSVRGGTVAVRIRRNIANYYKDLTIRSTRPSGHETELQKIKNGFGDYYLYLWTENQTVADWWLVDINGMRKARMFDVPRKEIWNRDGSSAFIAFTLEELKKIGALISAMKKA